MSKSPLLEELKLNRDFDPPAEELYFNIIKTIELLNDEMSIFFKQYDLTENQYNVLRIVSGAGSNGLPCQQIAQRLIYRVPDVTRLVNRLSEKKLVKRQQDQHDKRVFCVSITQAGQKIIDETKQPLRNKIAGLFEPISMADQTKINQCFYQLRKKP